MTLGFDLMRHRETAWSFSGQYTVRTGNSLTKHGRAKAPLLGDCTPSIAFAPVFCSYGIRPINRLDVNDEATSD
jgi:broad specificity phosphatase PhoE